MTSFSCSLLSNHHSIVTLDYAVVKQDVYVVMNRKISFKKTLVTSNNHPHTHTHTHTQNA